MLGLILTGLVAILHVWFLILEMFLWQKPIGLKTFGITPEMASKTAVLAKNQGLYNGFLAAGLIWSFYLSDPVCGESVRMFFLSCVLVAGIFGAVTAKFSILFVQAIPALLALLAIWYRY